MMIIKIKDHRIKGIRKITGFRIDSFIIFNPDVGVHEMIYLIFDYMEISNTRWFLLARTVQTQFLRCMSK